MARVLTGNVYVQDPETLGAVFYAAGDTLDPGHYDLVGKHLFEDDGEPVDDDEDKGEEISAPAKSAPKAEWVAYADHLGVDSEGTTQEIQERVAAKAQADADAAANAAADAAAGAGGDGSQGQPGDGA